MSRSTLITGAEARALDEEFWHARWRVGDTGFHQPSPNDLLLKYWASLDISPGARVFVPLAGKSVDMHWLAAQGHAVTGVELSEIAVTEFFSEASLVPSIADIGAFTIASAGPYTFYRGDIFNLTAADLNGAMAAYDRAALVALPPTLRRAYAAKVAELLPPGAAVLLISLVYADGELEGPPFSVPTAEIAELFEASFEIRLLETRDGMPRSANLKARGVSRLEEAVYALKRRM